jgi:hypothetical protein
MRFTDTFLPLLQGKASDLILELMAPNYACVATTKDVQKKHEPVTEQQAPTAQNEYVRMGERARNLRIIPDLLRPSCEDLQKINDAGEDAVVVTLSTIARLTTAQVTKLLDPKGRKADEYGKMIVTYGGVLHNDPAPSGHRADYSFGPALAKRVDGRYVALDIFVPEFIEDNDVWRTMPWFVHYDANRLSKKTTLFTLADGSFALIFPRSVL